MQLFDWYAILFFLNLFVNFFRNHWLSFNTTTFDECFELLGVLLNSFFINFDFLSFSKRLRLCCSKARTNSRFFIFREYISEPFCEQLLSKNVWLFWNFNDIYRYFLKSMHLNKSLLLCKTQKSYYMWKSSSFLQIIALFNHSGHCECFELISI